MDYGRRLLYAGDSVLQEGDWITLDGDTGEVMEGRVEGDSVPLDGPHLQTLMRWTLPHCQVRVRAEADGHREASRGRRAGAAGVGLCRTEQMFFGAQALQALRLTLLAEAERERKRAIADLIAHQRPSYHALLSKMDGLPVCIRLLDPPLTSFLPRSAQEIGDLAEEMGLKNRSAYASASTPSGVNPLLGQRGCRLGLSQASHLPRPGPSLFEAAAEGSSKRAAIRRSRWSCP